ncbi:MAG: response regulator transcription factor [Clostridia bacterium]|nr:response regulator transcription factor [Clostridia bacterium]
MSRILIVEDERKIARYLALELEHEGYEVDSAGDGRTGLERALSWDPDLIILDLMLPELSGVEVCRRVRHESDVPIIMLTAKDDVSDKVMGLDMGADDYMTKPFAIEELLARIRAALRKPRAKAAAAAAEPESAALRAGDLVLDPERYTVTFAGEPVALTKKEFDLLHYLMERKGKAVTRDAILNDVWGYDYTGDTNVVDVYVRYLRHKLDDRFGIRTIQTIRSVGYVFSYE